MTSQKISIVPINDNQQFKKEFAPILSHWNKKGIVRFIPFFYLYKELNKGNLHLLKLNKQTVGILWLTHRQRPNQFIQIEVFAMHPDWQSQGLGDAFCKSLIQHINEKYHLDIELNVKKNNNLAIDFYKKNGFTIESEKVSKTGVTTFRMKLMMQ